MPGSEPRESWESHASFLLACIGSAVGLGNIWRFPYLCYKSGGGAFLIPYVIMILLCGLPLLYMEITIGQYTRRGPIGALGKISPLFKGAGVATVVISFWLCTYYNVIISWALFYLGASLYDPLPWTRCDQWWNTEFCGNSSRGESRTSTQEFYDNRVLEVTKGISDFGSLRWELFGLLFVAWLIVYFCIWKSIKATGKVVYFTATVPYLLLLIFMVRGCSLPGADEGLKFLFKPDWERMLDAKVWVNAAAQVFNSIGIAFGGLITFSSYNKFHGPILRDTIVIVMVDAVTCILCGICVFSTMGNLAYEQNKYVSDVVTEGPGLVFVVFPHALAKLPWPQVWSAIFFLMLLLLGIDSQFATVEVVVTSLKDGFSDLFHKYLKRHEVLVLLVCTMAFICSIPNVYQGGIYYFQIVDYYAAALSLMYIAFFECIAIVWVYGVRKLSANIKDMTGFFPHIFFKACWWVVSPAIIFAIWMFSIVDYKEPTYNRGNYVYPPWAIYLGWAIAFTSLVPIPGCALLAMWRAKAEGIVERVKLSVSPRITVCPCGCEAVLDENHEAHSEANFHCPIVNSDLSRENESFVNKKDSP